MAGIWRSFSSLVRPTSVVRAFRTSAKRLDQQVKADSLGETHKPTNFQKKTLVWAKVYKNLDEVPERVSTTKLTKARDISRIFGTTLLIGFGAVASFAVVLYSRNLRNNGQDGVAIRHERHMDKLKADAEKESRQKKESAAADTESAEKKHK